MLETPGPESSTHGHGRGISPLAGKAEAPAEQPEPAPILEPLQPGSKKEKKGLGKAIRTKCSKLLPRRKKHPPPPPFPYSLDTPPRGCYLCLHPSPSQLPPNSPPPPGAAAGRNPSSYHDFLRSLLESNDFYSPDCNIHRDAAQRDGH